MKAWLCRSLRAIEIWVLPVPGLQPEEWCCRAQESDGAGRVKRRELESGHGAMPSISALAEVAMVF